MRFKTTVSLWHKQMLKYILHLIRFVCTCCYWFIQIVDFYVFHYNYSCAQWFTNHTNVWEAWTISLVQLSGKCACNYIEKKGIATGLLYIKAGFEAIKCSCQHLWPYRGVSDHPHIHCTVEKWCGVKCWK